MCDPNNTGSLKTKEELSVTLKKKVFELIFQCLLQTPSRNIPHCMLAFSASVYRLSYHKAFIALKKLSVLQKFSRKPTPESLTFELIFVFALYSPSLPESYFEFVRSLQVKSGVKEETVKCISLLSAHCTCFHHLQKGNDN